HFFVMMPEHATVQPPVQPLEQLSLRIFNSCCKWDTRRRRRFLDTFPPAGANFAPIANAETNAPNRKIDDSVHTVRKSADASQTLYTLLGPIMRTYSVIYATLVCDIPIFETSVDEENSIMDNDADEKLSALTYLSASTRAFPDNNSCRIKDGSHSHGRTISYRHPKGQSEFIPKADWPFGCSSVDIISRFDFD
ncbi:unnamed protein product, partial [Nesidiocoris tenuis]